MIFLDGRTRPWCFPGGAGVRLHRRHGYAVAVRGFPSSLIHLPYVGTVLLMVLVVARGAEEETLGLQPGRAAVTAHPRGFPEKTDYHSAFPSPAGQKALFYSNDYAKTEAAYEWFQPCLPRPTGAISGTPFGLALGQQPIRDPRSGYVYCLAPNQALHYVPQQVIPCRGSGPCHRARDNPAPQGAGEGLDQARRRQWPSGNGCEPS